MHPSSPTEFAFVTSVRSYRKSPLTVDNSFGLDGSNVRAPRKRQQVMMWRSFGIAHRKITDSLKGTLTSWPIRNRNDAKRKKR